jgi:hypothetical protein
VLSRVTIDDLPVRTTRRRFIVNAHFVALVAGAWVLNASCNREESSQVWGGAAAIR